MKASEVLVSVLAIAMLLLMVFGFSYLRFKECRRVHPLWYCVTR